jgi:hypothetical protein
LLVTGCWLLVVRFWQVIHFQYFSKKISPGSLKTACKGGVSEGKTVGDLHFRSHCQPFGRRR